MNSSDPDLVCEWHQDGEDSDTWDSGCGESFWLENDNPSECGMRYCCYCGKRLVHVLWEEDYYTERINYREDE